METMIIAYGWKGHGFSPELCEGPQAWVGSSPVSMENESRRKAIKKKPSSSVSQTIYGDGRGPSAPGACSSDRRVKVS
jgi:hypothetical protein